MKHGTILAVDDNRNILATVRMILDNVEIDISDDGLTTFRLTFL